MGPAFPAGIGRMRIRVIQKPRPECIEGVDLARFHVGLEYEVGNSIGDLFLVEKWAVPVVSDEPAVLLRLGDTLTDEMRRLRDAEAAQLMAHAEALASIQKKPRR
jgi:hypothetical protein